MNNNDSDWLDNFIIIEMVEEDEAKEQESSPERGYSSGSTSSAGSSESFPGCNGCSNFFIILAVLYIVLKLLT